MLTFTELRNLLGITQRQLSALVNEGMPHSVVKGKKQFDEDAVASWLEKHPRFEVEPDLPAVAPEPPETIYTTRQEVADHFGVSTRTIADWLKKEGFPGRSGGPGQQTGYFPARQIEEWLGTPKGGTYTSSSDRVNQARAKKLEIDIAKELRGLIPLDKYESLAVRTCNSARALIESMPDQVVQLLPADTPDETRSKIRKKVDDIAERFLSMLSQLIEGDEDDEEEEANG